jgi:hypothetical protein
MGDNVISLVPVAAEGHMSDEQFDDVTEEPVATVLFCSSAY